MFGVYQEIDFRIPHSLKRLVAFLYWATYISMGATIVGMVSASIYQTGHGVRVDSLLDAPIVFQALMIGGVLSMFLMVIVCAGLLGWCRIREFVLKRPSD